MRRLVTLTLSSLCLVALSGAASAAEIDAGVKIDEDGLKSFHLAISEHFGTTEGEVVVVKQRNIPDEELPVAYHIAAQAGIPVARVVDLRLQGMTWMQITLHLGLSPSIFYVEFDKDPGPPYGNAWGHFKNKPRKKWGEIRLVDVDIVNLVNLKFIAAHHGYAPAEIVKARKAGRHFAHIHKSAKAGQAQKAKKVHKAKVAQKQAHQPAPKGKKR